MYKKYFLAFVALVFSVSLMAQSGGVKGTVVNRSGRIPVGGADITLSSDGENVAAVQSAAAG